jgi:type II secretory pathway pseudopilin PulG
MPAVDLRDERGETLIEVLVSIVILGLAVTAIVAGLMLSVRTSDAHRKQTTSTAYLRDYAEAIELAVRTGGYQSTCAPTYAAGTAAPSAAYNAPQIVAVSFWNGTTFPASCNAGTDQGIQQLKLQLTSKDGRATEQLYIVLRRPCSPVASGLGDTSC